MTQAPRPETPGHDHSRPQPRAAAPATAPTPPMDPTQPDAQRQQPEPAAPARRPVEDPQIAEAPGPASDEPAIRRSRFGGLWVGLIIAAVVLVLLLIFILQNSQTVRVDYFGLSGHLPLAVAILLGVAAGALLVALPGTVRILQLRKTARNR